MLAKRFDPIVVTPLGNGALVRSADVAPPPLWGDPNVIRERLGARVGDLTFDRATMLVPMLSLNHQRELFERTAGPVIKLVDLLSASDPAKLSMFRAEVEALSAQYRQRAAAGLLDDARRQGVSLTGAAAYSCRSAIIGSTALARRAGT